MSIEMKRSIFEELETLCKRRRVERNNRDIDSRFSEIMLEHDVDIAGVPQECREAKDASSMKHMLREWLGYHGVVIAKKVWSEDEIKNLIQTNDTVLYGALKNLYACQTADEQATGETVENNGVGFNGVDAEFLSSVAEFLKRTGFLTDKQKVIVRRKLVKYNKQLTRLANA